MLFVMFFLAGDIFHHRRDIRFADAENSVACLPSKIWAPFFANPTRGICFYDAGKFGRSPRWTRTHEHVDVIGGAADDLISAVPCTSRTMPPRDANSSDR